VRPEPPQLAIGAGSEHDRRAVKPVLEPRRNDSYHALMPIGTINADRVRVANRDRFDGDQGLLLHRCLDFRAVRG